MTNNGNILPILVSVFIFLCFFVYMQHSSQVIEELKVEKLYREHCKSDSIISARIDSIMLRLDKTDKRFHLK